MATQTLTLSGTFQVGETITANTTGASSYPGYRWVFFSNSTGTVLGNTSTKIFVESTSKTFVITEDCVGLYMRCNAYNMYPIVGSPPTPTEIMTLSTTSSQIIAAIVSNVCFLAGTKIVTDQGITNIEKVSNKNSINGQNVNFVSMTENVDDYMVVLKKDALYKNVPNADTYVTGNHKIFFNRQMIKAKNLVNNTSISKMEMERAVVYNVLLEGEEDGKMIANGMIAETLSPKSPMTEVLMMLNNANLQERAMMISNFNAGMMREHNSRKVTSKKM